MNKDEIIAKLQIDAEILGQEQYKLMQEFRRHQGILEDVETRLRDINSRSEHILITISILEGLKDG